MIDVDSHEPLPAVTRFVISRALVGFASYAMIFALNVWIFQTTESYTKFALMVAIAELPTVLLLPIIGGIIDRLRRILVLCVGDLTIAAISVLIPLLNYFGHLSLAIVSAFICLVAISKATMAAASSASITSLVEPERRSTINGYMHTSQGITSIVGPIAGAMSFEFFGVAGTALICSLAYLAGLAILASVTINDRALLRKDLSSKDKHTSLWRRFHSEYTFGIRWIWRTPSVRYLSLFFMTANLGTSIYVVALTPYLLSFSTATFRGFFASGVGLGLIAGGLLVGLGRRVKQQADVIAVGGLVMGAAMFGVGICRDHWMLLILAISWGVALPIMNATDEAIWQVAVPLEIQGRINAARYILDCGSKPFAVLISVPFTTKVLSPLVSDNVGTLSLFGWWGHDTASPLGLLLSFCGLVMLCALPLLSSPLSNPPSKERY